MQCLGCITKCFIFNAAIPQMEVFKTYLYPDIICRQCSGRGCWVVMVEVTHYMQQVRGGGGAGRGRDRGDLAILSPAARSISQAPVGSRYTQHSAPCQPRSVYRDTELQSLVRVRSQPRLEA